MTPRAGFGGIAATVAATLAGTMAAGTATAQSRGLTPLDVVKLRSVRQVFVGPGGMPVVFTRTAPRNPQDDPGSARTHVFVLEGGRGRPLVAGTTSASSVALVPDGKSVSYLHQADGDDHAEVWSISVGGGEPTRITRTPHGVRSYRWRPDGQALAFTALDPRSPAQSRARAAGFRQVIVDEGASHQSLWLWDRGDDSARQLTSGRTVFAMEWSPDGSRLAAKIAPVNNVDASYMFVRLHVVDPTSGEVTLLADNPGKLGGFAWSPDSRELAYISAVDRRDPHAGNLFVVSVADRRPRLLTPGLVGMVHHVEWARDPLRRGHLLVALSTGVHTSIAQIRADNGIQHSVFSCSGLAFRSFTQLDDGGFMVVASTASHPDELFAVEANGAATRLTSSNRWLDRRRLGAQCNVRYPARDGVEIESVLMHPVGYQAGVRYPLVVVAHGGPESHYSEGWNTSYGRWGQMLCARGYFALYQNYRGSTGYGVEFAKANHGDVMGREFDDILDGVDFLVQRGLVDRARVGIGGGSYGGFMAAWAATKHSEHFAASVSFVPVTDMQTKLFVTDIPFEGFYVHQSEIWPHGQWGYLRDRSPTNYVEQCRTPLLLLGGTSDTRVHPSQPFMLYRAVKFATETPTRYVQYPGEGHGNRRNVNQYDYALRTLRWFDHYLREGDHRSATAPEFDLDYGAWKSAKQPDRGGR